MPAGEAPEEAASKPLRQFYGRLLAVLRLPVAHRGQWQLLECASAWEGNGSNDDFICFSWQGSDGVRLLVTVNYAAHPGQCYVRLPFADLSEQSWMLRDLLSDAQYQRDGSDLRSRGLYLDIGPWQYHVFEMQPA